MRKTKGDTKIMKVRKIKTAMCAFGLGVMMLAGTVSAGKTYYSFTLNTTGKSYVKSVNVNRKTILSDPWTLNVLSISYPSGTAGLRYAPYKVQGSVVCTKSGIWRKSKGYTTVKYGDGDAAKMNYALAAREDDTATGKATTHGWWNADKLKNQ